MTNYSKLATRNARTRQTTVRWLLLLALAIQTNVIWAQVSGRVADVRGNALPGANVHWAGTTVGTTADADGAFTVPSASATRLVASYVGYQNDTLTLTAGQTAGIVFRLREGEEIEEVVMREQRPTTLRPSLATEHTEMISARELVRAACCNLGESFTTNPSVDVNYSDAATGARQIRLLGLSGTYVQMLAENVPTLRGAATPFGLGYVPGPWMQSIQVSKGASSVKNGYESISGQINIEYFKPQAIDGVRANAYYDTDQKVEANAVGTVHLTGRLSTGLLLHYENRQKQHDGQGDGFMDMPRLRQINLMDRWAWVSERFISQLYVRGLAEERRSGQMEHGHTTPSAAAEESMRVHGLYHIKMDTRRAEATWKNAIITSAERNASVALIASGTWHDADSQFGHTTYDVTQRTAYAQLMYETDVASDAHNLSVGASLNHDSYTERSDGSDVAAQMASAFVHPRETTSGLYAQYTYKAGETLTAMAGLRVDHSTWHGTFWTPRLHVKYAPTRALIIRASAGKGYRSPRLAAENVSLLASSRQWQVGTLHQEEAWNAGLSVSSHVPLLGKSLALNAEYYYTTFRHQMLVDMDVAGRFAFVDVADVPDGESYSHVVQVDATYPLVEGLSVTAAWRYQDARQTTGGALRLRPLQSRYKALATASYKTPLELWQMDVTWQQNGSGRLPEGYGKFHSYGLLSAQLTREFRLFSIYVGGENLTGFRQKYLIAGSDQPFGADFDATMVWGPATGAMGYVGLRFNLEK